jgi:hypothetical protein
MVLIQAICAIGILTMLLAPELPFSRIVIALSLRLWIRIDRFFSLGRLMLGIGIALTLFGAVWFLPPDAVTMTFLMLPELAVWFTTFEIATLVEATLTVGIAATLVRASGFSTYLRNGFSRSARSLRKKRETSLAANDDEEPRSVRLAA